MEMRHHAEVQVGRTRAQAMIFSDLLGPDSRDTVAMVELNNRSAEETSLLHRNDLDALLDSATFARGLDRGAAAFLIAVADSASYDNPNFKWFQAHRKSFVYVDRIVVSQSLRGQGIARLLYQDLFTSAEQTGFKRVVCEVNLDPPNPASDRFHAAMGFSKVGEATIHGGAKTVSYLERLLA